MYNKQGTGNTSGTADSSAAVFMADILQKFGGPEKAMEAFAMFAAVMGKSVPAVSTSAVPPPDLSGVSTSQPEAVAEPVPDIPEAVTEPDTTVPETTAAETHEEEADLAAGLELLAVSEPRLDSATEEETPGVSEGVGPIIAAVDFVEGETPGVLEEFVEGETPVVGNDDPEGDEALNSERNLAGETPEVVGGTESQIVEEDVKEGETPEKFVGIEAHVEQELVGVESPVYLKGTAPFMSEEGEALVTDAEQDPVEDRVKLIVDLTDVPEGTNLPIDSRDAIRLARRSLRDEIEEHVPQTEERSLGLETAAPEQVSLLDLAMGRTTRRSAATRSKGREKENRLLLPRPRK
ncbi:uncharacterized protein LOC121805306 isoform X1 [Salvia splendens]|uniref:uncharacterized protein LOC121805306 isoform X1 n=1 Tax=Salvia splendens TaxID=180675 RepID=UPI001C26E39C|nr:uncharacterized protein LOC121805306 isoform X1 [Salvia splendens]XP_042061045.1 uncharacterized protein LOC121805306 isoform X1 [Salvia splendens]